MYVLEDSSCLELFMAYLAPGLLRREVGPIEGLRKVLYTGLRDNLAAIFNKIYLLLGQKRIIRDSRDWETRGAHGRLSNT